MMKVLLTVSMLGLLASGSAYADCAAPDDNVQIPNGTTATRDEMIAAQKAVKAYDASVKAYSECLQQESDAKIAAGSDKNKTTEEYAKRANVEVDKVTKVADKFNVELRAYKTKNAG
jgi:hypothetical protein